MPDGGLRDCTRERSTAVTLADHAGPAVNTDLRVRHTTTDDSKVEAINP